MQIGFLASEASRFHVMKQFERGSAKRCRERPAGVWGRSPHRGPGAAPLAGVRGQSSRKIFSNNGGLEAILAIQNIEIVAICGIKNCKIIDSGVLK